MEYKGYYLNNTDGVNAELIQAWRDAIDDYERLSARQAEVGDCFEAACAAAKAVSAAEEQINAEYFARTILRPAPAISAVAIFLRPTPSRTERRQNNDHRRKN